MLVPPFGWEGISAWRNLKWWARELAEAGFASLRYQPPGEGDSEGLSSEQDLQTWVMALTDVVAQTRIATRAAHVTVIALGLGGLVAFQAVNDGAAIDDLVVWAAPSKGRLLLRELKAFAATAIEPGRLVAPDTKSGGDDGTLWVHGYSLGLQAQAQLNDLDVAALGSGRLQRALMLGRGTLRPDSRAVKALEAAGVEVTSAAGPGYDELTLEPRLSEAPVTLAAVVRDWLRQDHGRVPSTTTSTSTPASTERATAARPLPVGPLLERRLDWGEVDAILTPTDGAVLTAVFIGAGAIPRSGPNRLWAESARRWAAWGVASLRLDLGGIGEAPDDGRPLPLTPGDLRDERYRAQVRAVLDRAEELGLPDRFLLVGLCSGGYWAGQVALDEPRVAGAVILNPSSLVWPPPVIAGVRRSVASRQDWSNFLRYPEVRKAFWARARLSARLSGRRWQGAARLAPRSSRDLLLAFDQRSTRVTVALSPGEAESSGLDQLPPSRWADVHHFDGPMNAHTLSPVGLRQQAQSLLDLRAREVLELLAGPARR